MTLTIYDFTNAKRKIKIPAESVEDIDFIQITVLSGDETGIVLLKNGNIIHFDASDCRVRDFHDGSYCVVETEKIKQWLEYKPTHTDADAASRERLKIFS